MKDPFPLWKFKDEIHMNQFSFGFEVLLFWTSFSMPWTERIEGSLLISLADLPSFLSAFVFFSPTAVGGFIDQSDLLWGCQERRLGLSLWLAGGLRGGSRSTVGRKE